MYTVFLSLLSETAAMNTHLCLKRIKLQEKDDSEVRTI